MSFQGQTKEHHFGELKFKQCPSDSFAREHFKKSGVEHYWDQAYSGAILETSSFS
jgi:U4/U6 small nuclear ribonucleoprotein PRP3